MLNARVIIIKSNNADSGNVSLQQSDVLDYINGNLTHLYVVEKGIDMSQAEHYAGDKLAQLIGRAIARGPLFSKDTQEKFYLAPRK